MKYPTLSAPEQSRQYIDTFYGYNAATGSTEAEFVMMQNMSSDHFPALAPRGKRKLVKNIPGCLGMTGKDALVYVAGNDLIYGDKVVDMGLSAAQDMCPKQLVTMGGYVCVFPDKKKYNSYTGEVSSMEVKAAPAKAYFSMSRYENFNSVITQSIYQAQKSSSPSDGDVYMAMNYDTGTKKASVSLMKYYASTSAWFPVTTYQALKLNGTGYGFKQGDYIDISGFNYIRFFPEVTCGYPYYDGGGVNGTYQICRVEESGGNTIIYIQCNELEAMYYEMFTQYILSAAGFSNFFNSGIQTEADIYAGIVFERRIPDMDYVCELNNRLWGCSSADHEIYACKLGDPDVWHDYSGLSTDSYAVTVGSDGNFTGCARYNNTVLFFKENLIHKVMGTQPSNFQLYTIYTMGVQQGSSASITLINEVLYYKSENEVCYYDGSTAEKISGRLGLRKYYEAAGGGWNGKYYISMRDEAGGWNLFAYDIAKGIWHREDSTHADMFAVTAAGELYFHDALTDNIWALGCDSGTDEEQVEWMAATGSIGYDSPDHKYLSRFNIRMTIPAGEKVEIDVMYDSDGCWVNKGRITKRGTGTVTLPIVPRRCDHMNIRFRGRGSGIRIISLAKIYEKGSDA